MPKYRKKPVVITAYLWIGDGDLNQMAGALDVSWSARNIRDNSNGQLEIPTLEGIMIAMPGDWIIKGVKGELYPCKPDIFAATYEPAE